MVSNKYIREKYKNIEKKKDNLRNCNTSNNGYHCEYIIKEYEYIESDYFDLRKVKNDIATCRVDHTLNKIKYLKVLGYVRDCDGKGKRGIMVTLFKQDIINSKMEYTYKADAISDSIGYFQFVIYRDYDMDNYLVKINNGDIYK